MENLRLNLKLEALFIKKKYLTILKLTIKGGHEKGLFIICDFSKTA